MKLKVNIDTESAAARLVGLATKLNEPVYLTDGANMRVSAKSMLGAVYATMDFSEVWIETENDHYYMFKEFASEVGV